MNIKTCVGCKFYIPEHITEKCVGEARCTALSYKDQSMVNGKWYTHGDENPYLMRSDPMKCGPLGHYYLPADEKTGIKELA